MCELQILDGDPLSYTANVYSSNATASLVGNLLTIDPADGYAGEFLVSVTASDGIQTVRETFMISVENVAPVLSPIGSQAVHVGRPDVAVAHAAHAFLGLVAFVYGDREHEQDIGPSSRSRRGLPPIRWDISMPHRWEGRVRGDQCNRQ